MVSNVVTTNTSSIAYTKEVLRIRNPIMDGRFHAIPQRADPIVKAIRANRNKRFAPTLSVSQPEIGINTPMASTYAVMTHWIWLVVALSSDSIVGIATFTMLVSKMDINTPIKRMLTWR